MFLPPGLLTLFFLANAAVAFPQISLSPNGTNITSITSSEQATVSTILEITEGVHITEGVYLDGAAAFESCTLEYDICCSLDPPSCRGPNFLPALPTESSWGETDPATNRLVTLTPTKTTVTTTQPKIINLETNIAAAGFNLDDATQASGDNNGQPFFVTQANTARSSNTPGQAVDNVAGGNTPGATDEAPSATGAASQQTGQNSLLLKIVSQLGGTPSNIQPASPTTDSLGQPIAPTSNNNGRGSVPTTNNLGQPIAPTSNDDGRGTAPAQPATIPDSDMPNDTNAASAPPVPSAVGTGSLIIGAWTVTLTPGLSINLAGNTNPTILELTTDATGNTLVTVSSSGTAVTATVRVALTTMTMPISGFEASVTDSPRPGEQSATLATTSSKGAGADRKSELEWWAGAVLGVLGFGMMM